METIKTETLSFRVPSELKTEFLEIFKQSKTKSKPELFKELLKSYEGNQSDKSDIIPSKDTPLSSDLEGKISEVPPGEIHEDIDTEIEEKEVDPEPSELEISVKLNPVQAFALRETILNDGFKEDVNKLVDKVDNSKDTSWFGNSLYSGAFKGVFLPMDLDESDEESINKNMGIALVNQFMSGIVIGAGDMLTPVTGNMIKQYIKESQKETEEKD